MNREKIEINENLILRAMDSDYMPPYWWRELRDTINAPADSMELVG